MGTLRITVDVPKDVAEQIKSVCGRFKDFPSKQNFIYGLIENYFNGSQISRKSVKDTDDKSSLKDRFYSEEK